MAERQLLLVAQWEQEKEQRLARTFQLAQQEVDLNKQKLASLEQYRLDYLHQTQQQASSSVAGQNYHQLQNFVGKLDKACQQQMQVHQQSMQVAQQRKDQWLQQQKKRKAVEMLLEKKRQQRVAKENRAEQAMLDELATQQFVRRKSATGR